MLSAHNNVINPLADKSKLLNLIFIFLFYFLFPFFLEFLFVTQDTLRGLMMTHSIKLTIEAVSCRTKK